MLRRLDDASKSNGRFERDGSPAAGLNRRHAAEETVGNLGVGTELA